MILVLLLLVLPATLSRGAWLAAIAGCGIILGNYFHLYKRLKFLFQKHRLASFIATICIFLLVTGTLIGIYQLKKESADGRRLIWKVSSTLVASHPATGVGFGHFAGAYGEAQAAYFSATERPAGEELVADAPETAFNEFVQITTETGIIGLLLFLTIIFWAFKTARHPDKKSGRRDRFVSAFLVFACFSYPFSVLPLLVLFTLLWHNVPRYNGVPLALRHLLPVPASPGLFPRHRATGTEQAYKCWKSNKSILTYRYSNAP
ncbi:MAG: O-antigen ligase family protein [Butyricimonas faecihominis]